MPAVQRGQEDRGAVANMTDVHDLLGVVSEAQGEVALTVLGKTGPGDVFYLVDDPATVILHYDGNDLRAADDYPFMYMGDEIWHGVEAVGTGDLRQRVVVIHNTRKARHVTE
jgi:hypothetical protein